MMAQSPTAQTQTWEDDLQPELVGALCTGVYELLVGAAAGHVLQRDARVPALVPNMRPILQIPPAPVRFVGRHQEVAQAVAALSMGQAVELWGESGMGKSALLRYLAHHPEVTTSHPDGILNLGVQRPMTSGRTESIVDVRQTLIDTFYYTYPDGPLPVSVTEQALGTQQSLVLVDGGQWSAAELQQLQATLPRSTFLVASVQPRLAGAADDLRSMVDHRAALNVQQSAPVQTIELRALPLVAMRQLLEQVLMAPLTLSELEVVTTLWERFQGSPQRLLQAAAIVQQGGRAWADLAAAQAGLSTKEGARALAYQAWQSLATPERWIVALLMAMPGVGLRQEQIAQITGPRDPRVNLQALVQWRLVMVQGDRYQLATPLKGAIGVEFDAQPWLERALTYWLAWVGQADVEAVLMDLPGLIYILRWAVGQGRWAEVLQLARALDIPLTLGKQWDIWGRVLQWALQAAWHQQDPAAEAWVWHQLGTRALCQDDVTTAYDALSQALKLRQDLGDRLGTALTLHNRDGLMQAVVPLTDRSVIETRRERSKTVGRWSKPSGQQATTVRAASRSENQRSSARVGEQGKTALALALLSIVTFAMALGLGLGFQKWLHWGPAHSEVPSNSIAEP